MKVANVSVESAENDALLRWPRRSFLRVSKHFLFFFKAFSLRRKKNPPLWCFDHFTRLSHLRFLQWPFSCSFDFSHDAPPFSSSSALSLPLPRFLDAPTTTPPSAG